MTLRERLLDAMLDGDIGRGLVVKRQELMRHFADVNEATTGVFLSNSEITTGAPHSPMYTHFTQRLSEGTYRIHPGALLQRLNERTQQGRAHSGDGGPVEGEGQSQEAEEGR